MRCSLTTPPFMQVLPIKRRSSCDIGARYCEALCAAMMTQFLYRLSCSFRLSVAAVARNCARASCTTWCGDTRALCAQQWFGWVTNVIDYRSNGAALCLERSTSIGLYIRRELLFLLCVPPAPPSARCYA